MVNFNFIGGDSTFQERELMKETFLTNLAEFREEFESKDPERTSSFIPWPVPTSYTIGINANF